MSQLRAAVLLAVTACAIIAAPSAAAATHASGPRATTGPRAAPRATAGPTSRATADLTAVSCTSASFCTAVGSTELGTLAERWNGRRWTIQQTPSPGRGTALAAVSCASPVMCMAVGSAGNPSPTTTLAELWNGHTWSVRLPVTPHGRRAELLGVSCPTATMCIAVGAFTDGLALAELWNGKQWALQPVASVRHAQIQLLESVSCTSPADCTAVGSYASLGPVGTVAERWNGATWVLQASPQASGLPGVSCAAATACAAVGQSVHPTGYPVNFAMGWNGNTWTAQATPNPAHNAGTELSAVSCPSPAACFAVGDYFRAGAGRGGYVALAERWNGTRWALLPAPSVRGANFLVAISCNSAVACMAVGTGGGEPLAERWNGAKWVIVPAPSPPPVPVPGSGSLTGVSCTSAANCTAVGSQLTTATITFEPLAEHWNGSRWSAQQVPNPVFRSDGSQLSAVWCLSRRACTAVGFRGNGLTDSLAERWDGHRWAVQSTPNPSVTGTSLAGVFCASATSCTAAGLHITSRGLLLTLAEHWNGRHWARQRTPSPPVAPGAGGGLLGAVGCSAAEACTAVGAGEIVPPVIERWNGTKWGMQRSPRVRHPGPGQLTSVSCPAAAMCLAAGDTGGSDTNFHAHALAELWNGKTWAIQRIPEPPGTGDSYLNGISCSSPVACTAVGARFNRSSRGWTLAERWDGKTWAIQDTPSPPGLDSVFTAVSCPSATACVAVGHDSSGPLAARWNGKTWVLLRIHAG